MGQETYENKRLNADALAIKNPEMRVSLKWFYHNFDADHSPSALGSLRNSAEKFDMPYCLSYRNAIRELSGFNTDFGYIRK